MKFINRLSTEDRSEISILKTGVDALNRKTENQATRLESLNDTIYTLFQSSQESNVNRLQGKYKKR